MFCAIAFFIELRSHILFYLKQQNSTLQNAVFRLVAIWNARGGLKKCMKFGIR
ncbi:hypothetical protein [Crinalium epipsammum]|uniref:hypothetical protein n=1 Tax=Crinalium epipsammum TaxID=241425 RepID=UPI0012FBCFA4|nr:hypothetical protein [Crinalium epipsammum]